MAPTGRPAVLNFLYGFSRKGQARTLPGVAQKSTGISEPGTARPTPVTERSRRPGEQREGQSECLFVQQPQPEKK